MSMIKSYVKRCGRMTPRQCHAIKELWPKYGITLNPILNNQEVISPARSNALQVLEIGFGMGRSLIEISERYPEIDFLGIEVHTPGVGTLLAELEARKITNVRIFHADAVQVLTYCIPNHFLDKIFIFFPDPWPKRRHHKRRLIQKEFIALLFPKLKTGGILHLATDWEDYAKQMMKVISAETRFLNKAGLGNFLARPLDRPLTKFEQRGEKLGHKIWDLVFQVNNSFLINHP